MRAIRGILIGAVLLGAWVTPPGAGVARAQTAPSAMEQRLIAMRLADLEAMVAWKWWPRADVAYGDLAAAVKQKNVTNPVIRERLDAAGKALDEHRKSSGDAEIRRVADFQKRVAKVERRWRIDRAKIVRCDAAGAGDARTLAEALAKTGPGDAIELYTGIYTLDSDDLRARGPGNRPRARVFWAAPGHWPRIVAPDDQRFTIEEAVFLDGLEVWPGQAGVSDKPVNASNCYFRSPTPPPAADKGATGLTGHDRRMGGLYDCVFRNFLLAARPGGGNDLHRLLFITCVTGLDAENDRLTLSDSAFYRCLHATAGREVAAERCRFVRVGNRHEGQGKLVERETAEGDDAFVNPFANDYRPRGGAGAGPRWDEQRWRMLRANFDLSSEQTPRGLAELLAPEGTVRLAAARAALEEGKFDEAAAGVADLLGRLADCPTVPGREVEQLASRILSEAAAAGAAPRVGVPADARKKAEGLLASARAAKSSGEADKARLLAEQAVAADDTHVEAHQLLAELWMDGGRPTRAEPLLERSDALIAAAIDPGVAAWRAEQARMAMRLSQMLTAATGWQKLREEFLGKYTEKIAPAGGLPSTAMIYRRASLLGDPKNWQKQLADAESALVAPLPRPVANGTEQEAQALREQGAEAFRERNYLKAIEHYTGAWVQQQSPDDLLKLAQCYQRLEQATSAALLAMMVRQAIAGMADKARSSFIERDVINILRTVDPTLLAVEQLDRQFEAGAAPRRAVAEAKGDKDTVEDIDRTLMKLKTLDAAAVRRQAP